MTEVKNRAAALRIFAAFFYLWYIAEVGKKILSKGANIKTHTKRRARHELYTSVKLTPESYGKRFATK